MTPCLQATGGRIAGRRAFDLFVGVAGLIVLFPVLVACALVVRLTSRGAILHLSDRIGENNAPFKLIKFRTMRVGTPQLATHLLTDPQEQLTRVGGFLRRSSLDEFPQLINVVRGEMSIVGPRPALFNQADQIELRTKAGCHVLKPGITGWAQVNGRDRLSIPEKVEMDTWYCHNRSLALDLEIIWLTIGSVFSGAGVRH
jgi:O-antigen biosynthesis protein WbqP